MRGVGGGGGGVGVEGWVGVEFDFHQIPGSSGVVHI